MARRKRPTTVNTVRKQQRVYRVVTVTKTIKQCEPIYVRFGEAVRQLRGEIGMTQQELADAIGLGRPSITNIERGRQRILLGDLFVFAKILCIAPRRLLERVS